MEFYSEEMSRFLPPKIKYLNTSHVSCRVGASAYVYARAFRRFVWPYGPRGACIGRLCTPLRAARGGGGKWTCTKRRNRFVTSNKKTEKTRENVDARLRRRMCSTYDQPPFCSNNFQSTCDGRTGTVIVSVVVKCSGEYKKKNVIVCRRTRPPAPAMGTPPGERRTRAASDRPKANAVYRAEIKCFRWKIESFRRRPLHVGPNTFVV